MKHMHNKTLTYQNRNTTQHNTINHKHIITST